MIPSLPSIAILSCDPSPSALILVTKSPLLWLTQRGNFITKIYFVLLSSNVLHYFVLLCSCEGRARHILSSLLIQLKTGYYFRKPIQSHRVEWHEQFEFETKLKCNKGELVSKMLKVSVWRVSFFSNLPFAFTLYVHIFCTTPVIFSLPTSPFLYRYFSICLSVHITQYAM